MNPWIQFLKEWAIKHRSNYACSLADPRAKEAYRKLKDKKKEPKREEPKKEEPKMSYLEQKKYDLAHADKVKRLYMRKMATVEQLKEAFEPLRQYGINIDF